MNPALFILPVVAVGVFLVGLWLGLRHGRSGLQLQLAQALDFERRSAEAREAGLREQIEAARREVAGLRPKAEELAASRAAYESLTGERARAVSQLESERDVLRADLRAKAETDRTQSARISQLETELRSERQNMGEKVALLETARQALANQFESLAAEVLEKKSKTFAEASHKDLDTLLAPLQAQIREFREKVEQAQSDSKTGVTKLETLIGSLNGLNQQLSQDARNLTTALRGSAKAQGDWGEFILRDLLDKAGLREGEQYTFQQSFTGVESDGSDRARSVRTDVVLFLPGGRNLVIDSKVSLNAYTDSVNATSDDDRRAHLKLHLASVRAHIANLAKAGYHRLPELEAPDFVVMFVPVEPAFLMALQADGELWSDAYKQGILLVGPTTLLYVIRIINVLWQQERQARNVREVMDRGTELYEKFVGFVTDMEVLGDSLRKSDQHYTNAMKKLADGRGNLIRQVEMLKKLGLRTTKSLPRNLLDRADVDQAELALAAETEDQPGPPR
jgi:DNA recombination protein RmuC